MASAAGAFLNEGVIRSSYSSPVDVFDHPSLGRLTNCLVPFNYGEDVYSDDAALIGGCCCYGGPEDGEKMISIGTGGYPPMMMELFDHHSAFCDDSFLDLNVFDSVFNHEPETTTTTTTTATTMEVEGHIPSMTSLLAPQHSNSSYHPSPVSSSSSAISSSSLTHIFPPSPDINAFLYPDDEEEEEEEEEEDVYSSSQEDALRNLPIFVATGRVSEDERNDDGDDDDDDRKGYSRVKVKVENVTNSYNKRTVIPRTIANAMDGSSAAAPKRVRRRKDQLWYFLLEILGDPEYNPNYIQWENKDQGIFRFIESKKVAQLWGEKKKRSGMSYEYFARAMRHYYSRGIMRRVTGRRLVYQFGPKAENWRGYAQQVTVNHSTTRPLALNLGLASVANDDAAATTTGRGEGYRC